MTNATLSLTEDGRGVAALSPGAYLVLAMDFRRPLAASSRFSLAETDLVVLGRGDARGVSRSAEGSRRQLRIDVDDGWVSTDHARMTRSGVTWVLADAGSKNGTRVNGVKQKSCELADGDVIEAGHSLFVFREAAVATGDILEQQAHASGDPSLTTLSPELRRDYDVLTRVAASKVSLLVYGESGTGKEVAARAVHEASGRSGRFVAVNCAALPDTLIEAELFGAEKGAFSGAVERREGLVRASDGGTLFLDEIAELPEACQGTLLRVLQEGEVLALGATTPRKVDLRVVAATNRDLREMADSGTFRPDLYARLRGLELELPPLRERREDLGLLVASLLRRAAPERADRIHLHALAARALFAYAWPYNVRELAQALAAALAIAPGDELELEHLPKELGDALAAPVAAPERAPRSPLADAEELRTLLDEHKGNVSAVARAMKTSRSHVRRLAERFGIDLDSFRS